ncbi:hypothetical protein [Gibbsiella quercinecans]|uniref:Uncharacterized protein n=1 Tax=Gibbsiella dentisursi TaxID=796890 RepID=A0ABP7L2B0_9GAMM
MAIPPTANTDLPYFTRRLLPGSITQAYWLATHVSRSAAPGGNMKNSDKDPDDTFSDLLKVIAVAVIIIIIACIWYISA